MGTKTGIAWTDATWNCWQGCHKVSPGCKNCYMFTDKTRYGQDPNVVVRSAPATFNAPLSWARNPEKCAHIKRIFVCSWSDFFIEEADPWRAEAWAIMRKTPQFIYQLCTKRPERIAACLPPDWGQGYPNVWLLTSTENQAAADLRIPILLSVPAVVHGISAEPLLGPLDLRQWLGLECRHEDSWTEEDTGATMCRECEDAPLLDWVIAGGESGTGSRQMDPAWARSLRDQCKAAGTAFFMKQGSAANWDDFKNFDALPEDLQVREFPQ